MLFLCVFEGDSAFLNMASEQPGETADRYSFDAPSHVINDFNSDSPERADHWFSTFNCFILILH